MTFERRAEGLPRRISVAPASRHRDHHVRARGHGGARRQHGQSRRNRGRRRPVDDGGQRHRSSGDAEGRRGGPDARVSALGEPAGLAEDDGAALPGGQVRRDPFVQDDDGVDVRIICGTFWGTSGPVDGIAAEPIYLDVTVPAGKRKTLPVETTRHAFAYVFGGAGKFWQCVRPAPVRTDAWRGRQRTAGGESLARPLRPRRRGHGAGGRTGHPIPARVRKADRGTRCVARPDRHEHAGGVAPGIRGAASGHVPEEIDGRDCDELFVFQRRHWIHR